MVSEKAYLSQEKFDTLKQELEHLTTERRREIAEKLEYAKSLGDLSENSEYQEAREDQSSTEERIAQIESLLRSAEIVHAHTVGDIIEIGSKVVLMKDGEDKETTYEIVGDEEANISQGKISNKSPLGVSLMDKKKDDKITARTPSGEVHYTIISVN